MKKPLIVSLLILAATASFVGCKSGFGSCFSRTGSRVPTTETASTESLPAAAYDEVVMMQTSAVNSVCTPCEPNACSPCNPCAPCTSAQGASAAYPAQAYPGI